MATELGPTRVIQPGAWGFGRIEGLPLTADVSSPFGPRVPILTAAGWTSDFHTGVDLPAPQGTPVCAPADCVVTASYRDSAGGQTVVVRLEDGTGAMFIHMEGIQLGQGAQVRRGDFVGFVGTSGLSTGYHLHYSRLRQVLDGPAWYDPSVFIDPLSPEGGFSATLGLVVNAAPAPEYHDLAEGTTDAARARVALARTVIDALRITPQPYDAALAAIERTLAA